MLSESQRIIEFVSKRKSILGAYLLWFFFGLAGGHNFYTDRIRWGIFYLLGFFPVPYLVTKAFHDDRDYLSHSLSEGIAWDQLALWAVLLLQAGIVLLWIADAFFLKRRVEKINIEILKDLRLCDEDSMSFDKDIVADRQTRYRKLEKPETTRESVLDHIPFVGDHTGRT